MANKIDNKELIDLLKNAKLNSTGQYVSDCPFCGKEKHFYISKSTQQWDCKRCGESGGIGKLLRYLGKTHLLEGATIEERAVIKSIKAMQEMIDDLDTELAELPDVCLPVGAKPIKKSQYLLKRGFLPFDYEYTKVSKTRIFPVWEPYLIFPVFENGKIKGFVGRFEDNGHYKAVTNKDINLRYKNSRGTNFGQLLYGYDDIIAGKTSVVILVEGIFDKLGVDRKLHLTDGSIFENEIQCVATFGKKISSEQIAKLISKKVSHVILLYDWDATNDIKKYGLELEKYFVTRCVYLKERKDVDEIPAKELLVRIEYAVSPKEFTEGFINRIK